MSNKFFSFLHGQSLHIAPETKVVPKNDISILMDARQVLSKAKEDAKKFKEEIVAECEKERTVATKEGFEKGFSEWTEKIVELEEEIQRVRKEMEKVIIPVALKAAKKIVGREIETSEKTVVDIVSSALKGVSQHKKVTIWANKDDLQLLEKEREHLKSMFEKVESLSLRPRDDISSGGCVIETEAGIINAQLENQWLILESAFEKMMIQPKRT